LNPHVAKRLAFKKNHAAFEKETPLKPVRADALSGEAPSYSLGRSQPGAILATDSEFGRTRPPAVTPTFKDGQPVR
jgi:hypothetical protein